MDGLNYSIKQEISYIVTRRREKQNKKKERKQKISEVKPDFWRDLSVWPT